MANEDCINFIYKKNAPEEYEINKLLTSKESSYHEQLEKDYLERLENYCKENNIKFPNLINSNIVIINNSSIKKNIDVIQNFYKNFSNEQLEELIKNVNIAA